MKKDKSTFQKALTTGKKTLAIGAGIALGFVTQYAIVAKKPTNAEISQRSAQTQIVQIDKSTKGFDEAYQLTKTEELRQSEYSGLIIDKGTLKTLGVPKEAEGAYILSKDKEISVGDIVLPIDKNGKFIPKSYVLSAKLPEKINKFDYVLLRNGATEGTFVYSVNNKNGNVSSNFIPKSESEKTKSTLENKVSSSCENTTVDFLGRKYSEPDSTTLLNVSSPNVDIRTADMGGTPDCTTTQENKYEKIDSTTIGWQSNTPYLDAYTVTKSK